MPPAPARPRTRRASAVALLLGVVLLVLAALSASVGSSSLGAADVLRIAGHHLVGVPAEADWSDAQDAIVWTTRLPRVLLGAAVGAILAVSGVALQAIVRNPLADPYVLGISSGASTGAAFSVLVIGTSGALSLSGSAFAGALCATLLVLALGGSAGARGPMRLVLAGMAVGYALSAVTGFLVFASDSPEGSRAVMFWLMGSLSSAHADQALLGLVTALLVTGVLVVVGPILDAVASGDDTAFSLGIRPERARFALMTLASVAVAVAVAVAGGIGFVGLVVPHAARAIVGSRHRDVLPVAALLGAAFLVLADVAARMAFAPVEMPIGVITGVVGAPFLIILLRRLDRQPGERRSLIPSRRARVAGPTPTPARNDA